MSAMIIVNWVIFLVWAILTAQTYVFAFRNRNVIKKKTILLVFPTAALIIFSIVFVLNRGSQVAQLSSSGELWSLWFHWYFPLVIGNVVCLITTVIFLSISLIKQQPKSITIFDLHLLVITLFTLYHILPMMPDA